MSSPSSCLKIFTGTKIGDLNVSNRIVLAPLTRGRATPGKGKGSKVPTKIMADYYAQRAQTALIISEATAISEEGSGWFGASGIYEPEHVDGWKIVTDKVHEAKGIIFCQLWHMGRAAHSSFHANGEIVSASAIAITSGSLHDVNNEPTTYEIPRALTTEEIPRVVRDYAHAAKCALDAGFDGIEVHAANGYLIDQFLQSVSNNRTDNYGGSIENRTRFLFEILETVSQHFPINRIGVRISPNGVFNSMGSQDNEELFLYLVNKLRENKFKDLAYVHVMDGLGFGFHKLCRQITTQDIKKAFGGTVIGNCGYDRDSAEKEISRGDGADLIAIGRPFIANPDLIDRYKNNWPLASPPEYSQWYGNKTDRDFNSTKFYTDYPKYTPQQQDTPQQAS